MNRAHPFRGQVEFQPSFAPRPEISHVLFDFDGTLSLIRQGWPEVMVPMFVEMLPLQTGESPAARRQLVFEDIMRLNGKQTIYQMIQLAERIRSAAASRANRCLVQARVPAPPDDASASTGARTACAVAPSGPTNCWSTARARCLDELQRRGLPLYLASGTDEVFVKQEAELLDVARYFGPHIYGARTITRQFSKKMVIDRILRENRIAGGQLLAFGDGYVEIQNTKEVGGLAVAVASDEAHNGSGRMDEWKRQRLLGVGADVVIPDFRDASRRLLDCSARQHDSRPPCSLATARLAAGSRFIRWPSAAA